MKDIYLSLVGSDVHRSWNRVKDRWTQLHLIPSMRRTLPQIWSRAGTGRDFVPESLLLAGTRVPVTIAFWAFPQLENIHLNENN